MKLVGEEPRPQRRVPPPPPPRGVTLLQRSSSVNVMTSSAAPAPAAAAPHRAASACAVPTSRHHHHLLAHSVNFQMSSYFDLLFFIILMDGDLSKIIDNRFCYIFFRFYCYFNFFLNILCGFFSDFYLFLSEFI